MIRTYKMHTLAAAVILVAANLVTANAAANDELAFHWRMSGLVGSTSNDPGGNDTEQPIPSDQVEDVEDNWSLTPSNLTLPTLNLGSGYSHSLLDSITPSGLTGFAWSSSNLPSWLSLNGSTGEITNLNPDGSNTGVHTFIVSVTKGAITQQATASIEVAEALQAACETATTLVPGERCDKNGATVVFGGERNGYRIYTTENDISGRLPFYDLGQAQVGPTVNANHEENGELNTTRLLAYNSRHLAAAACRNLGPEWYLPSIGELYELGQHRSAIGGFNQTEDGTASRYWSSTENGSTYAKFVTFSTGRKGTSGMKHWLQNVRCITK